MANTHKDIKKEALLKAGLRTDTTINDFANTKTIKDFDVINFSFNKTKLEQVYTFITFKYNYNYSTKKYDSIASYTDSNIDQLAYNGYSNIKDNELVFESPFIRDKSTAEDIMGYMFRDYQFQHLTCKIKLPLHYIHLDVGDTIKFDKLLGGMKAFGIDYTRMVKFIETSLLRGSAIYPMFFITSVSKNLNSIEIEARQIHHIDNTAISPTDYSSWGYIDEWAEPEEEEEVVEPPSGDSFEINQYSLNAFRTVHNDFALMSTDLGYWFTPEAFGLDSFNSFIPNDFSTFSTSETRDYEVLKLSIKVFNDTDGHYHNIKTLVIRLRNVGGSSTNPASQSYNFQLGWTLEILDYDETVFQPESAEEDIGFLTGDIQITPYIIPHNSTFSGMHHWNHTLEIASGLNKSINEGLVDLDELTFYAGGITIAEPQYGYGLGDLTGDGTVSILDIVSIVNYILQQEWTTTTLDELGQASADWNQDGVVNIMDIIPMMNNILGAD